MYPQHNNSKKKIKVSLKKTLYINNYKVLKEILKDLNKSKAILHSWIKRFLLRGLDYEHMIKARAHKGGVRIDKTPKKLASICCP
jgi:hypothetical protein